MKNNEEKVFTLGSNSAIDFVIKQDTTLQKIK